jgi:hypothetical protein
MWDTVVESSTHLSHEMPCPRCGHEVHRYLPCSDACACSGYQVFPWKDSRHSIDC